MEPSRPPKRSWAALHENDVMQPRFEDSFKVRTYIYKGNRFYEDGNIKKMSFQLLNGMEYGDGDTYKGIIRDGEFYGKFKDKVHSYKGDFKAWKCDGKGVLKFENGSRYEGEFKNGCFHGKGRLTSYTGRYYVAEFQNDELTGYGELHYENGDVYEGTFLKDKIWGYGKKIYSNGNIYFGEWKDRMKDGSGTMIYSNGSRYEGLWKRNMRHGWGHMIFRKDGKELEVYEGVWKNDIVGSIPNISPEKLS